MVINPKNSQKIMAWGVEMAIGLLFDATVALGNKIAKTGLFEYFKEEVSEGDAKNSQISKTIYELKRKGYIQFEGDSVKLTNKAKMKIVDKITAELGTSKKYHLISFDIPEIKRQNRNGFRRAIKKMGFVQIQKSLWVTTKNAGELVETAAEEYGVGDYVAYFVSEKSNIDEYIAKIINKSSK